MGLFLSNDDVISIDGINVEEIAEKYGTPIYVYSEKRIKENFTRLADSFSKSGLPISLFYAIKACNNINIAKILVNMGAGIDAASPNEIKLAKLLGLDGSKIIFTGNNLSGEDIEFALQQEVVFNVDDNGSLQRIFNYGTPTTMSFRVNPGGDSSVTGKLTFGGAQAKFGIAPDNVYSAYLEAKKAGVTKFGAHMMPGSCALSVDYFKKNTETLLSIMEPVVKGLGIDLDFIDLGGGLGIPYRDDEKPLDVMSVTKEISNLVDKNRGWLNESTKIFMEPARYFVGDAGYLIGTVHSIKDREIPIIGTDISMNVLARPAMYAEGGYHRVLFDGRENDPTARAGVCGQVCENTDFWIKERNVPASIEIGDRIVVLDAGAYGYSMSYQYNGRLRPAEALIREDGIVSLIRYREKFEDVIRQMVIE